MRIIAGEARGRRLLAPRGRGTRPPLEGLRESLFNILGEKVEGARVLDLFAGSGAFGLEAISRGATFAAFVENDPDALEALDKNILNLGFLTRAQVIRGDALHRPSRAEPFDVVFMDPPFAMLEDADAAWALAARLEGLLESSLRPGGVLIVRHPPKHRLETRREPDDRRTFGASRILFFRKPGASP